MSKFGKWIVLSLLILLLCGGLALSICYMCIPLQTKSAIDIVVGYLNTPIGLGLGITITGGAVLTIFIKYLIKFAISNSKYGKESLSELQDKVEEAKKEALTYKEKALEIEEIAKTYLSNFNDRVDYLSSYLEKVCETSPNAKIKALGKELISGYNTKKEELSEELTKIKEDVSGYVSEKINVSELSNRLKELESKVYEYGKEREETIND